MHAHGSGTGMHTGATPGHGGGFASHDGGGDTARARQPYRPTEKLDRPGGGLGEPMTPEERGCPSGTADTGTSDEHMPPPWPRQDELTERERWLLDVGLSKWIEDLTGGWVRAIPPDGIDVEVNTAIAPGTTEEYTTSVKWYDIDGNQVLADDFFKEVYGDVRCFAPSDWGRAVKVAYPRVRAVGQRTKLIPRVRRKLCDACDRVLPANAFGTAQNTRDRLNTYCSTCYRAICKVVRMFDALRRDYPDHRIVDTYAPTWAAKRLLKTLGGAGPTIAACDTHELQELIHDHIEKREDREAAA